MESRRNFHINAGDAYASALETRNAVVNALNTHIGSVRRGRKDQMKRTMMMKKTQARDLKPSNHFMESVTILQIFRTA